jgi:glutamate synthase (ferredoxin)
VLEIAIYCVLIQGNLNWMASRRDELTHPVWGGREADLLPLCKATQSDSASLDNTAELLVRTGEPIDKSLMVLVPEAYQNHPDLDSQYPAVKDFYRCASSSHEMSIINSI